MGESLAVDVIVDTYVSLPAHRVPSSTSTMLHVKVQQQAAALFVMAENAREKGDLELAELFTMAACRCLNRLKELYPEETHPTQPPDGEK